MYVESTALFGVIDIQQKFGIVTIGDNYLHLYVFL